MSIRQTVGRSFTALAAGAVLAWSALASPAVAQIVPQVELTTQSVEGIIASYPEVKAKADELKATYDVPEGGDIGSAWGAWMAYSDAMGQFNGVVQPYGFADFQTWVTTLVSVSIAYSFAKDGGQIDASMQQALDQIKNNPNLSDAQKEVMLQQLQASLGVVSAMAPSQANIDAVTPYMDQIAEVLDL